MPTRRSHDRAMAWWRQYRQAHRDCGRCLRRPSFWALLVSSTFLHRQTAAPASDFARLACHPRLHKSEPRHGPSMNQPPQSQGPVVAGRSIQPHASNLLEGGADGRVAASQVRTAPSNPTPVYEPAKLPPAPPTPAATTPPMNLPPAANAAAAVPLPLPAPLQNAAKGRAMQTTPSGEDPAGVKVTLKVTPVGLSKATPQKAGDAAPATPHETAASAATEVARPQVPPSTSQPS